LLNSWYEKNGENPDKRIINSAPINAPIIAGTPNLSATFLSASFPTNTSLNILLSKCTIPVKAIAISTGKKITNTGVRIVPNPKPVKNVSSDAISAVAEMIIKSMTKNKSVK